MRTRWNGETRPNETLSGEIRGKKGWQQFTYYTRVE